MKPIREFNPQAYRLETETPSRVVASELNSLTEVLTSGFITYFPSLGALCGPKAALMLGHALYLTRSLEINEPHRQGWFWKSRLDWSLATGLSMREQMSARARLVQCGLMEESRAGMPARLYYRINLAALASQLSSSVASSVGWSWDEQAVKQLLGRPVIFHAPFAWLVGSSAGGLYLAAILSDLRSVAREGKVEESRYTLARNERQWNSFGLGDKACRSARACLEALGVLESKRQNRVQGCLQIRVDLGKLSDLIVETVKNVNEIKANPRLLESSNLDCWKPAIYSRQKRITRDAKGAQQDLPFPHNNTSQKRTTSYAEMAKPLDNDLKPSKLLLPNSPESSSLIAETKTEVVVVLKEKDQGKGKDEAQALIFPKQFTQLEIEHATVMLVNEAKAQLLLDEIAGKLHVSPSSVRVPLGLLNSLLVANSQGRFIPSHAARIQARRSAQLIEIKVSAPSDKEAPAEELRKIGSARIDELRTIIARRVK